MTAVHRIPAKTLSFTIGVLSLGAETLWVRTATFAGESTPRAFSFILGIYLVGIALGAVLGARLCARTDRLAAILTLSLLGGSLAILAAPFILAAVSEALHWAGFPHARLRLAAAGILAFLPAFIFSICFPICHHIGTARAAGQLGKSMSRVYCANIAGSVLGPLIVNFVLLQFFTTQLAFAQVGLAGVLAAFALLAVGEPDRRLKLACGCGLGLAVAGVLATAPSGNWLVASLSSSRDEIRHTVESRQGIVVAYRDDRLGDIIHGGNVYDGRTNLDPRINSNGINRLLVLASLRPEPKRVLVIGLSVGTWLALLTGFPGVEKIDVVEINPGYLDLIKAYPRQQTALEDPRSRIHIGDGRKFLRTVPAGTYDLIVMNTTWHWRAYSSLLLSRELLLLARNAAAPGGLIAFNSTGSPEALKTASTVCPHAYLYDSFVICGDTDWRVLLEAPDAADQLGAIMAGGKPIFDSKDRVLIEDFLSRQRTSDVATVAAKAGRPLEVITDRNLITEYKYGR